MPRNLGVYGDGWRTEYCLGFEFIEWMWTFMYTTHVPKTQLCQCVTLSTGHGKVRWFLDVFIGQMHSENDNRIQ